MEDLLRAYFSALSRGEVAGNEDRWYAPGAFQVEWPNAENPLGAARDLLAIREANEKTGDMTFSDYEIGAVVVQGDLAAVETTQTVWTIGEPGGRRAVISRPVAFFFRWDGTRIARQTIYGCDPY